MLMLNNPLNGGSSSQRGSSSHGGNHIPNFSTNTTRTGDRVLSSVMNLILKVVSRSMIVDLAKQGFTFLGQIAKEWR